MSHVKLFIPGPVEVSAKTQQAMIQPLMGHRSKDFQALYERIMPNLKTLFGTTQPVFGSVEEAMVINPDFAPTFMDLAGLAVPADMQGRSLVPLFRRQRPSDWRTSMYYRYYHDPGHHNTRAHYGVRTPTHKLIHYWKKDQWELFDLTKDPDELRNLYGDPAQQETVRQLKTELSRLKRELKDDDQFADQQPGGPGVDGPFPDKPAPR